ncbi:MAG: ankyrin repeat domain-containing protein, partial [Gemmatimonadaceae bacterium]
MSPALPARPDLEHLKKQAKALLHDYTKQEPAAVERFRSLGAPPVKPKLADSQHIIAREHGFGTWAELKAHVESISHEQDPR